jgi:hypothetical protein
MNIESNPKARELEMATSAFTKALGETALMFRAHGFLLPCHMTLQVAPARTVTFRWDPRREHRRERLESGFDYRADNEWRSFESLVVSPDVDVMLMLEEAIKAMWNQATKQRDTTTQALTGLADGISGWLQTVTLHGLPADAA